MSSEVTHLVNRRDALKTGVAALVAQAALAQDTAGQERAGPYDLPTVKFNAGLSTTVPPWAFRCRLPQPLVPRPTFIGRFEEVDRKPGTFGPQDQRPVGEVFHGVALEWGQTPEHWSAFGCNPQKTGQESWKDKQQHFGTYQLPGGKTIRNWGHLPIKCYKIPILELTKQLHPESAFPARMYGYAGMVPGPLLKMRLGQPVVVRYENHLETEVSIHLHGGHSPSHSDGFPSFYVLQGKARDYFYPNILPLHEERLEDRVTFQPDLGESQSSMWYHDHGMDGTGYNVSKGLAGFAPCFGEQELQWLKSGVLPSSGKASWTDPEECLLETDPEEIAKLEDPDHPGFYRKEKEPFYNQFDIPLVLQDRVLDPKTGQIAFDTAGHNGYLGDTMLVNGVPYPYLECLNRKYRFRILDGSNSRVFRVRLLSEQDYFTARDRGIEGVPVDDRDPAVILNRGSLYDQVSQSFLRIGKDSWLWSKALARRSIVLAMANRADIIVDFGKLAAGLAPGEEKVFYLVNTMPQFDGRGPKVALDDGGDPRVLPLPFDTIATADGAVPTTAVAEMSRPQGLLKIIVRGITPEQAAKLPKEATIEEGTPLLQHNHPIQDHEVVAVREFIFERGRGAWMINGRFYDPTIANATPKLGTAEEWVLRNGGGGWWHPIHIHLESHQLISYEKDFLADAIVDPADAPPVTALTNLVNVTGQIEKTEAVGLHDVQVLGPNTVARIRMRFRTWNGPFVFHCHNLEHEDMRMMYNFEPVPSPKSRPEHDPNVIPDARTHGNSVTLQPTVGQTLPNGKPAEYKFGELPFEPLPTPQAPASDAGTLQIPTRGGK